MTDALIIDGKALARRLRNSLTQRVAALQADGVQPQLDVVLIGNHPASVIYVQTKQKAMVEGGVGFTLHHWDEGISQDDAIARIRALNRRDVHGILVQMPVPGHLDAVALLNAVDPARDVDGLNLINVGRRTIGLPSLLPCTPKGCIKLIQSVEADMAGKHAVVIGRSDLVGKPMAQLLSRAGCSVTHLHKAAANPQELCRQGDIVVAAIGQPRHITKDWIKTGAIVIDVGISRVNGEIQGDIDFAQVKTIAKAITPVPGGVGPMTVACLMENVVEAAELSLF